VHHVPGKLGGPGVVAAAAPVGQPGRLALLVDEATKKRFLVDCGSVYSILPFTSSQRPFGPKVVSADKSPIACWGWRESVVHVQGRSFKWKFLLASVAFPLVGADFLSFFDLKVDLRRMRLESGSDRWHVQLAAPPAGSTFAAIGLQLASTGEECAVVSSSDPHTKIQQELGECEKRSSSGDLAPHLVPRIPQTGEDKVVMQNVPERRSLSEEGRAKKQEKRKSSNSYTKEYRDSFSKKQPLAVEKGSPTPPTIRRGVLVKMQLQIYVLAVQVLNVTWKRPPAARAGASPESARSRCQTTGLC